MPITSLNNISIPTEGAGSNQSLLMPKLQYRFRVILENFGAGADVRELTRQVVDVTRPNLSFEQITLDAYNSRTYLAGKHTWEPVTLNLREDVNSNVQRAVGQQLQRQYDFYEQASAASGGTYKFTMKIEILDGGNGNFTANVLDRYELVGCYIESANYNTLAYSTNDPVQIGLTIRYDNALQTDASGAIVGGVGEPVTRFAGGTDGPQVQATGGTGLV
jgi:hypothetical protein